MRPESVISLALAALLAQVAAAAENSLPGVFATGSAYDRSTGQLLYSEHHYCEQPPGQCVVRYEGSEGTTIARKDLDYRNSAVSPALVMVDYRHDTEVRIPHKDSAVVVDAGFDNFVRKHWDPLADGETVTFRFRGVGFDSPLDMKIGIEGEDCPSSQLCLAVNIDSWLLGNFVEPILLYYARDDRTLQRYSGVSNLKGEQGESLDVDIFYEYADSRRPALPG